MSGAPSVIGTNQGIAMHSQPSFRESNEAARLSRVCQNPWRGMQVAGFAASMIVVAAMPASSQALLLSDVIAVLLVIGGSMLIHRNFKSRAGDEHLAAERNIILEARVRELEGAIKELEAFSYSVSHDLQAPLRSIRGFSQALRDDCCGQLSAQGDDYIQRICRATARMGGLINDMLSLSGINRAEMTKEPLNIGHMAHTIISDLRFSEPQRQVEFTASSDLMASGDARLIRIVLENLLQNAWKFTSKVSAARIEVGVTSDHGRPAIFVRDNGAGFDMQFADKLFGPFQRLHGHQDFPGSGVGLATVQRIVHRHGGRVWAEGEPLKGATFYFTL